VIGNDENNEVKSDIKDLSFFFFFFLFIETKRSRTKILVLKTGTINNPFM